MKDITSTSFGLVIAFLLPGLTGLYALSFWFGPVEDWFYVILAAKGDVALFLFVLLASLIVGLLVSVLRWLIFERCICAGKRIDVSLFSALEDDQKLAAFRAVADEHYRYHQFWGGMAIVLPLLFAGWCAESWPFESWAASVIAFIVAEALAVVGAIFALVFYVTRGANILKGRQNA